MRTLSEILESAKDGGPLPTHEECLYAMLACEQLWCWMQRHYYDAALGTKKPEIIKMRVENDHKMAQAASSTDPKAWLGPKHDWSDPENRRRREISLKLHAKVAGNGR